ncbi:MAG: cation:proton antiporter [Bryobacteraceae bacterium]
MDFAFLAAAPEMESLALSMLVVFGSAKLLAEVFERMHQPAIVGEILAGFLVGPAVLGWIHPDAFLHSLSELGVMFLLFRVGLEVRASELLSVGGTALRVALLGVLVPFGAGVAITYAWGMPSIEQYFIGAAMVATSIGITAQVLASRGVLSHRASRIILAAAIIDDVLGLIVLAVVSSLAKGDVNYVELGVTAGLAVGFTVMVATWGSTTMSRLVPRLEKRLKTPEPQFTLAMILLFALALLATRAGVAAIIGAFLAGMALADSVNDRVHEMAQGVTRLLTPFFLVGIGMQLTLDLFANSSAIWLMVVIVAAAIASKFIGCGLGAVSLGWAEAARVGVGMIPRGEVGLVVAQLGASIGVIPKDVYGVVVFMSLATTLVAPPLLAWTFRGVPPSDSSSRIEPASIR